jgi:hypothetical protein
MFDATISNFSFASDSCPSLTPVSALARVAGLALTILFVPDITGLDLREADARWVLLLEGKGNEYHGPAVNWKNLSLWEWLAGYARQYDPKASRTPLAHISEKVQKGVAPEEVTV